MAICDKCGQEVLPQDDAVELAALIYGPAVLLGIPQARHICCSPSRAQYVLLLGVIDERPEYDKRLQGPEETAELEEIYTEAYYRLQEMYA